LPKPKKEYVVALTGHVMLRTCDLAYDRS